jgi:BolA protein
MASQTPVEDAIRQKVVIDVGAHQPVSRSAPKRTETDPFCPQITAALQPSTLDIHNDSHLHAHHAPMQGVTSKETHFRVIITSEAFQSKMQAARHRLVYSLLKDELAQEGGIHALQLRTMTPEEEAKRNAQEAEAE